MSKPIYAGVTQPNYAIEDGLHPARLFQIIQIGSHLFKKDGKEWYSPQILLGFELPGITYENMDGVKVAQIKSGTYFLSMNPSRKGVFGLREVIDGLRGTSEYTEEELEQFDISQFLGRMCLLKLEGVESKGQIYQNITEISPMSKDYKLEIEPGYEPRKEILVTIDDFKNLDMLNLPDWIQEKIRTSREYQEMENTPESIKNFLPKDEPREGEMISNKKPEDGVNIEDLEL